MTDVINLTIRLKLTGAAKDYENYNYKQTNLESKYTTIYIPKEYSILRNGHINTVILNHIPDKQTILKQLHDLQKLFLDKQELQAFITRNKHSLHKFSNDTTERRQEIKESTEKVIGFFLSRGYPFNIDGETFTIKSVHMNECNYVIPSEQDLKKQSLHEKEKEIYNAHDKTYEQQIIGLNSRLHADFQARALENSRKEFEDFMKNEKEQKKYLDTYTKRLTATADYKCSLHITLETKKKSTTIDSIKDYYTSYKVSCPRQKRKIKEECDKICDSLYKKKWLCSLCWHKICNCSINDKKKKEEEEREKKSISKGGTQQTRQRKKSTKRSAKKSTKRSAKKSTKRSAKKSTKRSAKKSAKKSTKRSAKKSTKRSTLKRKMLEVGFEPTTPGS